VYDNKHDLNQLENLSMALFVAENGEIGKITLYDYLSSKNMLEYAINYASSGKFAKMNSKDIADEILLSETPEEANDRQLKYSVKFDEIV
jgi:hypothetical protein